MAAVALAIVIVADAVAADVVRVAVPAAVREVTVVATPAAAADAEDGKVSTRKEDPVV